MAVLSNTVRRRIWRAIMRGFIFSWPGLKEDLYAAVAAADDWVDSNAASYNSALPQPFRSTATNAQKAILLAALALTRADDTLLAKIFEDS
jgi:hypothetical protein